MTGSAEISPCGRFRYALRRAWDDPLFQGAYRTERVTWIMLNPSTADGETDDATIRRCINFSRAWGYGALSVVNLFAFRATLPRDLAAAKFPIGDGNDEVIVREAKSAGLVVVAWGELAAQVARARGLAVRNMLECPPHEIVLHHLGKTASGQPRHPCRLPGNLIPQRWDAA